MQYLSFVIASVRRSTQSSTILSNCIDDVSGEVDISNFWKEHFERILDGGICNAQLKQSVVRKLQSIKYHENMLVSSEDIRNIVNKLKCGKSSGPDGISAESLKFFHSRLYVLLLFCFSLCLTHGYLPKSLFRPLFRAFSPIQKRADNLPLMKKTLFLHSFYEITK